MLAEDRPAPPAPLGRSLDTIARVLVTTFGVVLMLLALVISLLARAAD